MCEIEREVEREGQGRGSFFRLRARQKWIIAAFLFDSHPDEGFLVSKRAILLLVCSYAINWKVDHARTWKGFFALMRGWERQISGAAIRKGTRALWWNATPPLLLSLLLIDWKRLKVLFRSVCWGGFWRVPLCKHSECKHFHTAQPPTVFTWKFKLLMSANEVDSSSLRLIIDFLSSFHYSKSLIRALH